MVIVIVARAEELVVLAVTSLLGVSASAIETTLSLSLNKTNPAARIARMARKIDFFTSS
jgi:prolyl-tRNA editing enzyme YbaK/EbsC (Cys-tRNA(Pro) deacylase)